MVKKTTKPSHPGQVLKTLYLDPLGLTIGEVADNLGVTRKTLSMLLNERQGLSAEMALRLSKAFDTSPELWLNMQGNFDLWAARQKITVTGIKPFRRARALPAEEVIQNAMGSK